MCDRYGVGQIYFRQEKYEMAEYHFRRSLLINQRSSVLRCYVGVALHKIGRTSDALDQLQVRAVVCCSRLLVSEAFFNARAVGLYWFAISLSMH